MTATVDVPDAAAQIAGLVFAAVLIDPDNAIVQVNPAAEAMLGQSDRRLQGLAIDRAMILHDSRILERLRAPVGGFPDGGFVARDVALYASGRRYRIALTCSPLPGHAGWRMLTFAELSRGDRAADLERDLEGEGEDRVELRGPAILAHEIKNPLSAIRGASQLLGRRVDERDRSLTELITGEVDRIAGLVDRMQQLGSRPSVPGAPCNLHQAIRNAMATVAAGRDGRVALEEEFDPSLSEVAADGPTLELVLINLVANGCDAAGGAGGASVPQ